MSLIVQQYLRFVLHPLLLITIIYHLKDQIVYHNKSHKNLYKFLNSI